MPGQPPRRSWARRHRVLTAFIVLWVVGGISTIAGAMGHPTASKPTAKTAVAPGITTHPSATARAKSSAKPNATSKAADACDSRPWASGDIYVRMLSPGVQWEAQELGGEWSWDYTTGKCLTSVQLMIATAPQVPGSCPQVGYVADNPRYNANANAAAPLKNVVAESGPAC